MAVTIALNHRIRLTTRMEAAIGVTIENVFEVLCVTAPTSTDLEVMEDFSTWLEGCYGNVHSHLTSALAPIELKGHNATTNTPLPSVAWTITPAPSSGSDLYATGAAALILFRTASNRVLGRKFIGGLTEAAVGNSLLTAGCLADMTTFALNVFAGPTMGTNNGAFVFRIFGKNAFPHAVTTVLTAGVLAYQRRRRQGVGI